MRVACFDWLADVIKGCRHLVRESRQHKNNEVLFSNLNQ
jgi:hypothetical protein